MTPNMPNMAQQGGGSGAPAGPHRDDRGFRRGRDQYLDRDDPSGIGDWENDLES
jgi:hypothetical protein